MKKWYLIIYINFIFLNDEIIFIIVIIINVIIYFNIGICILIICIILF